MIFRQYSSYILFLVLVCDIVSYVFVTLQIVKSMKANSHSILAITRKDYFEINLNLLFLFFRGQIIQNFICFDRNTSANYYQVYAFQVIFAIYFFICIAHSFCLIYIQIGIIQNFSTKNHNKILDITELLQKIYILCFFIYFDNVMFYFINIAFVVTKIYIITRSLTYNDIKVRIFKSLFTKFELTFNILFLVLRLKIAEDYINQNIILSGFICVFLLQAKKYVKNLQEKQLDQKSFVEVFDTLTLIQYVSSDKQQEIISSCIRTHQIQCRKVMCFCVSDKQQMTIFNLIIIRQLKQKIQKNIDPIQKMFLKLQINQLAEANLRIFFRDIHKLQKLQNTNKRYSQQKLLLQFYPIICQKKGQKGTNTNQIKELKYNEFLIKQIIQIAKLQKNVIKLFQLIQQLESYILEKNKKKCENTIYIYNHKIEKLKKQKFFFYNQFLIIVPFFQLLIQDIQFNLNIKAKFKKFVENLKKNSNFDTKSVHNFNKNIFLNAGYDYNNQLMINQIYGDSEKIFGKPNEHYLHQNIRKFLVPQFKQIHQEIMRSDKQDFQNNNNHCSKILLQKGNIQIVNVQIFVQCTFDIFTKYGLQYNILMKNLDDQKVIVLNEDGYIVGLGQDILNLVKGNLFQYVQIPFFYYGKQLFNYFSKQEKIQKNFGQKTDFQELYQSCWKLRDTIYIEFYSKQIILEMIKVYNEGYSDMDQFRLQQQKIFSNIPPNYQVQIYIEKYNGRKNTFYQVFFEKIEKIKVTPKQVSITSKFQGIKVENKQNQQIEFVSNCIKRNSISKSKLFQKDTKFNKYQIQELLEIQKQFEEKQIQVQETSNLDLIPEQNYSYKIHRKNIVKKFQRLQKQKFTQNFVTYVILTTLFCAIVLIFNLKLYYFKYTFLQSLLSYHNLLKYMIQFDIIIIYFQINSYFYNLNVTRKFTQEFFSRISIKAQQLIGQFQQEILVTQFPEYINLFLAKFKSLLIKISVLYDNDTPLSQRIQKINDLVENNKIFQFEQKFFNIDHKQELIQKNKTLYIILACIFILTITLFLFSILYNIKFNLKKQNFLQNFLNQILQKSGSELEKTLVFYKLQTKDYIYQNNIYKLDIIINKQRDLQTQFQKSQLKIFELKQKHVNKKLLFRIVLFFFIMLLFILMNICCLDQNSIFLTDILKYQNFITSQFYVPFQQISFLQKFLHSYSQYQNQKTNEKPDIDKIIKQLNNQELTYFQFRKEDYKSYQVNCLKELHNSQYIKLCKFETDALEFTQQYCIKNNTQSKIQSSLVAKNFRSIFQKQMDTSIFFVQKIFEDTDNQNLKYEYKWSQYYEDIYQQIATLELFGLFIMDTQSPKIKQIVQTFADEETKLFIQKSIFILCLCIFVVFLIEQFTGEKELLDYEKNFKIYNNCNQINIKIIQQVFFNYNKNTIKIMSDAKFNKKKFKNFLIKKKFKKRIKSQPLQKIAWNYMLCEQQKKVKFQKSEGKNSKLRKNKKINLFSIRVQKKNERIREKAIKQNTSQIKSIFQNQYSIKQLDFYMNFSDIKRIQNLINLFVETQKDMKVFMKKCQIKIVNNLEETRNYTVLFWFSQCNNIFSNLNSYQKVNFFPDSDKIFSKINVNFIFQKKSQKYTNTYNFILKGFQVSKEKDKLFQAIDTQQNQIYIVQTDQKLYITSNYLYVFLKVFSKIDLRQIYLYLIHSQINK